MPTTEIRIDLPLPGSGATWERWRQLAEIAADDLSTARLVEGHADARAILAELGDAELAGDQELGVWAAESADEPLRAERDSSGGWRLSGRKRWCSGAHRLDAALVTARAEDRPRLFLVELGRPGVEPVEGTWPAIGMADSDSVDVVFKTVELPADNVIGKPGAYLDRPGFWHGGVGVAACWYGGAVGVARALDDAVATRPQAHRLAHRGAVQATLAGMSAVLSEAARQIDADPDDLPSARRRAYEVRYVVERDCREVLERVGLATGAEPLCHDADHARRVADLTVFLRQWHAEADLERLGLLPLAPRRD